MGIALISILSECWKSMLKIENVLLKHIKQKENQWFSKHLISEFVAISAVVL